MNVFNRLKQAASVSTVALCISVAAISQATAAERYIVSGVENWDTLNIRSEPNSSSTIIGEIPSNGSGVNSTGQTVQTGRSTWIKVNWNGVNGWVSKRYLATDYTYTAPKPAPVQATTQTYISTPDYSTQGSSARTGSIYDSGTGTVRSVYAGPGKGLPAITRKQQPAPYVPQTVNTANTHTHPANQCTRSVSHTHPNGANQHTHRYSCQGKATQQQQPKVQVRAPSNANTHTHPRNQFTNAVTHTHASGSSQHKHNYGGQQRQVQQQQPQVQVRAPASANTHTHPRNQFTNAVTHTHASGSSQHKHNYGGQQRQVQQQQPQVQVRAPASANTHTHPRNQFTNAVTHTHASGSAQHRHNYGGRGQQRQVQQQPTVQQMRQVAATATQLVTHIHPASPYNKQTQHTHAGGAGVHVHDFLLPPRQAVAAPVAQNSANAHRHPANNLTKSVMHTHPNGTNPHNHSYGGQR